MTITLKADVEGAQKFFSDFSKEAKAAVEKALDATGLELTTEVRRLIQRGPKTGRVYKRGKGRNLSREHQASAPGEAPATDTGALAGLSIYSKRTGSLEVTAGSTSAEAYHLEFGTQRIAPRPSWTPAVEKLTPKFQDRIRKAIERAAK